MAVRNLKFQIDDWDRKDSQIKYLRYSKHGIGVDAMSDFKLEGWVPKATEIGPTDLLHGFWYIVDDRKDFKSLYSSVCLK